MDSADKYLLAQHIAGILDRPSVYMGGPSQNNVRRAVHIVDMICENYSISPGERQANDAAHVRLWRNDDGTRKESGDRAMQLPFTLRVVNGAHEKVWPNGQWTFANDDEIALVARIAELERQLSEIHASTRRMSFAHEWYIEGVRTPPGEYVLTRVGPVTSDEPTF